VVRAAIALFAAAFAQSCGGERQPVLVVPSAPASAAPPVVIVPPPMPEVGKAEGEGVVFFVQDGREVHPVGHDAMLDRTDFQLVVVFPRPGMVLLNVSTRRVLFDRAKNGEDLGKNEDALSPGHGMAEEVPPDSELHVADDASHAIYMQNAQTEHRCQDLLEIPGGFACKRRVMRLVVGKRTIEIRDLKEPDLYFVALATDDGKDTKPRRDWIRLRFRAP
jgi:hypothetical protein